MNPLAARKQLLIAESELNRVCLAEDFAALTAEMRSLTERAKSFGTVASSAAMLAAGLTAFWGGQTEGVARKRSWLQTILKGAGLVSVFWRMWRAQGRAADGDLKREGML